MSAKQNRHGSLSAIAAAFVVACGTFGCGGKASIDPLSSGMEALRAGDNRKAVELLTAAQRQHPESATAQANLGMALWKCGRERQAVDPLRTAAALVPDDYRPKLLLGMLLTEMNLLDEARNRLMEARTVAPSSAEVLTALGAVEIRRQKYADAESLLQQALRQKADYPPALYNLGMLYRNAKPDPTKSNEFLRRYVALGEQDPHTEAVRRLLDLPASDGKSTRPPAQAGRDTATAEARTAFALGVKHQAEGKTQAAVTAYKHALALNPRYAEAAYNLALIYKAGGQTAEATAMLRQAVEAQPKMVDAHYMLAVLASEAGRTAETQRSLDTVLKVNPDHPKAHLLSGTLCLENNQSDQAAVHFEQFLRLAPNDASAPGVRLWLASHQKRTTGGGTAP